MSPTSLKRPDDLKSRALSAEQRVRFLDEARAARNAMIETGKGLDADEVHVYLKARASGEKMGKPKARLWRGF